MIFKQPANSKIPKGKLVVLFDSECMLCSSLAFFMLKFQKRDIFQLAPLESKEANTLLALNNIPFNKNSIVAINDKAIYTKADAVAKILSNMVWWLFPLRLGLLVMPKFISQWLYELVANNRTWLWKSNKCSIHAHKTITQQRLIL